MNAKDLRATLAHFAPFEPVEFDEALSALVAEHCRRQDIRERDEREEDRAKQLLAGERVGLSKGWVSSVLYQRSLAANDIPWSPKRIAQFLGSLGYIKHPGLPRGRPNNPVYPDRTKPTLYIQPDHYTASFRRPCDIERAYQQDQGYVATPEP